MRLIDGGRVDLVGVGLETEEILYALVDALSYAGPDIPDRYSEITAETHARYLADLQADQQAAQQAELAAYHPDLDVETRPAASADPTKK